MHGAVPEELRYQGDEDKSHHFEQVERVAVTGADHIVVVSGAMRHHLLEKYPGLIHAQFTVLPNFPDLTNRVLEKPYVNGKPVIVYAGGVQVWQQIPKIIDAIVQTIGRYNYKFFCPDPGQVISMFPDGLRQNPDLLFESKPREEVFQEYGSCHYGFILRENRTVNNVACPTKLVEYLALGVVPIVDNPEIGDFKSLGMQYVTLDDLLKDQLPAEAIRYDMVERNIAVYAQIRQQYANGVIHLQQCFPPHPKALGMNNLNKAPHLVSRFLETWKNQGFTIAYELTKSRLAGNNSIRPDAKEIARVDVLYFEDIYNAYISSSHNKADKVYIELPSYNLSKQNLPVKAISFYLPQYHPIPENDAWWGKGFTEWVNVSKAVPNFIGHYQPRLPGELGYYDLRVPEVMRRQVELAQKFGLYGFCFYYYWFNGRRLLDLPLDQFTRDPEISFPFCLCWANENWTRTWDGLDKEVLIEQDHSPDSDFAFIEDIIPYLKNPRYIRINDRPVLIVYRPQIITDPELTAHRWRTYCRDIGLGNLYLVAIQSGDIIDPRTLGFDAAVEFPPHGIPTLATKNPNLKITNKNFNGLIYDYRQIAEQMSNKTSPEYRLYKTVITGWDNTPRRQDQPLIFHYSSPLVYQSWLSSVVKYTVKNLPDCERFVFINAWNEWAESTYLEPDRKYGYAYLDATARALHSMMEDNIIYDPIPAGQFHRKRESTTAVIFHLFYPELWEEIHSYLQHLEHDFDLFVSIPEVVDFDHTQILREYPHAVIYRCANRGRDIAPFIKLFSMIKPLGYQYICKIHTKKSLHRQDGTAWRTEILNELLGSKIQISTIKLRLNDDKIGLIGPKDHILSIQTFIGGNQDLITMLANKMHLDYSGEDFNFIAGSMFWFKPSALAPILELDLQESDFPPESGQNDATIAHAIERVIGLVAKKQGFKVIQTGTYSGEVNDDYNYADAFRN